MAHFGARTRDELMHLAECAGHMANAVAIAVEEGSEDAIGLDAGTVSIPNLHSCHVEAAVLMMAALIRQDGMCTREWRNSIPELVAFIAGAPAA